MSNQQSQEEIEVRYEFSKAWGRLFSSFKELTPQTIKDIEFLIESLGNIFTQKSFTQYLDFHKIDVVNNFFRNVLNKIITNILSFPYIKDEKGNDLSLNLFYSIIKILFIYDSNPYLEIPKTIRNIFTKEKENPYFNPKNNKSFWEFNNEYCSDFIKNINTDIIFKEGDKIEVLVENFNKKENEIDKLIWMEGIIKKIEKGIYYIIYSGEDDNNEEICYPIGYPTVRIRDDDNWNWRLNLKKGDKIDFYHKDKWISSTIIDIIEQNEKNGIQKIKYKVDLIYEDSQNNISNIRDKENKYIYIYHFSSRIQKEGSFINEKNSKTSQEISIEQIKEELNEMIIYEKNGNNNIIIGKLGNFSYNFAALLKKIEKENIINDYLNILNNDNSKPELEIYYTIYTFFSYAMNYLHINFIKKNKDIFKKGYLKLLEMEDINIEYNEYMDNIKIFLKKISDILKEPFTDIEKEIKDNILTNYTTLNDRIREIKYLNEKIINNDNEDMAQELKDLNIINKIFGTDYYTENIKNSKNILKMMIRYKKLEEKDIKIIFDCARKVNLNLKTFIFKDLLWIFFDEENEGYEEMLINEITNNKNIPDTDFVEKLFHNSNKIEYKIKICKYYSDILIESNSLDLTNNHFGEFLNSILNDNNLHFRLFELYKEYFNTNCKSLIPLELITDLLKSDLVINIFWDKDPNFEATNEDLMNYLLDKDKPLIKIFEDIFIKYYSELKGNKDNNINIYKYTHESNIKILLNFLLAISNIYPYYNDFIQLLKLYLLDEPIYPDDKKYFYEFIEEYYSYDNIINQKRNDILIELYHIIEEIKEKQFTNEHFKVFNRLFNYKYQKILDYNIINALEDENYEIKLKSKEEKEFIFDKYWNLLFEVNNEKVIKKIMSIILQISSEDKIEVIYKINDQLNELDYTNIFDAQVIKRCYELLKIFFEETEKDLYIKIKPHFSLLKNCIIKFPLEIRNKEKINDKIEFLYGNTTLNEIKELLSKKYEVYPDYIEAYIQKPDKNILLDYSYSNKTLIEIIEELNIINKEESINSYLFFNAKEKADLIKGKELSPKLINIIEESFYKATNNREEMYPKNFTNFMNPKIKSLFKELNKKENEYLTKEEIFQSYYDDITLKNKKEEVIEQIKTKGYNEYLMKQDSFDYEPIKNEELFRYYLANIDENPNFLSEFIFNYNNIEPKINHDLFFYLPTNEKIYEKFLIHDEKNENNIYDQFFDIFDEEKQILKQLYFIIIIESFLQDIESEYISKNADNSDDYKNINEIFDIPNNQNYEISSPIYEHFDDRNKIDDKIKFFETFISGKCYKKLIKYTYDLIKIKKYEEEKIYEECLIKCINVIKVLYFPLIKKNEPEIKSHLPKNINIYYFDYSNIDKIFKNKNIFIEINISFTNLVQSMINYITSNYINNRIHSKLLYEQCLDLIIILISSNEKYFSELNDRDKSTFSEIIKEKIISNSSFIIEKILASLNYISEPSTSRYIHFLYDIFISIYSSILNNNIKGVINSEEYFELFTEFNKFIYDDNFEKKEMFEKIIDIIIHDSNHLNNKIFSEQIFKKYIEIFNQLLDIPQIRPIIFSYRNKENISLIYSLYHNIVKSSYDNIYPKIKLIDKENFISFEDNDNNNETPLNKEMQDICNKFIISCINKEAINDNSIKDLLMLYKDIAESGTIMEIGDENDNANNAQNIQEKSLKFVGLYNLSSICYMNATLQQLFMIYVLKYAILGTSNIPKENEILKQIQILFANLEFSEKDYFRPDNLCKTKIFNNKPIDIRVQQDSKEFYDSLCDSLENNLKNTKYKYIMEDALMGYMSHSIKCESCGYTSNQFESFYDLSLEVKDIEKLQDSLNKLIQEEKVDDFNCNNCNKKVTIRKRITLAKLPNTLFFHLKRFTYENQNIKIFSTFKFPLDINLKEFCTESHQNETNYIYEKQDDYYKYVLKGVVQHRGHANGGHYVSYINVNRDGIGNSMKEISE